MHLSPLQPARAVFQNSTALHQESVSEYNNPPREMCGSLAPLRCDPAHTGHWLMVTPGSPHAHAPHAHQLSCGALRMRSQRLPGSGLRALRFDMKYKVLQPPPCKRCCLAVRRAYRIAEQHGDRAGPSASRHLRPGAAPRRFESKKSTKKSTKKKCRPSTKKVERPKSEKSTKQLVLLDDFYGLLLGRFPDRLYV